MYEFDKIKNIGSFIKSLFVQRNQANPNLNLLDQANKNLQQAKVNQAPTLINTNSNIPINQATLVNPAINQQALNLSNQAQKNSQNIQAQEGRKGNTFVDLSASNDLPSYAGIQNISLKTWISEHDTKGYANLESGEKQLAATLEGIKGFQRKNQEDSQRKSDSGKRGKYFSFLSYIFTRAEQGMAQEVETLSNILNFRKLGSLSKENSSKDSPFNETIKLSPPQPEEIPRLVTIDTTQLKYLYQLLALPNEFPECIRFFAKQDIELNENNIRAFLEQRLHLAQEQTFGVDNFLNETIAKFAPLLNQKDFSILLPLVLLYYSFPIPNIKTGFDFIQSRQERKKDEKENYILASCNIYFLSKTRGRFILKFELNKNHELSFDIQTSLENERIVSQLELAVSESMFLLENPPLLSDLNVILAEEVHKATNLNDELSIISTGPIRIEIVLVVYASLVVLNRLMENSNLV